MPEYVYYILIAPPILLALTLHEYAHAYTAYKLGDDTAQKLGRLTLNPLKHLDLLGTIMLFIIQLGWAKPVPVNPEHFSNPRRGMLYVAAAGPASNILQALAFGLLYRILLPLDPGSQLFTYFLFMIRIAVIINLILAFFNLIPIPPLDGSKIAFSFLPARWDSLVYSLDRFGPFILLGIILVGNRFDLPIIWTIIRPPVSFLAWLFGNINF